MGKGSLQNLQKAWGRDVGEFPFRKVKKLRDG